jgi:HK97 family phage major capsid protein
MAPPLELSDEQKTQVLGLIKDIVVPELGPIVKEVVQEHLERERPAAAQAQSIDAAIANAAGTGPEVPIQEQKGQMLGRLVRAIAATKGDRDKAIVWAKDKWGDDDVVVKALLAGDSSAGGFLVPPEYRAELIDLLTAKAVVRSLGPTIWPMETGTVQVPKQTAASTAAYIGESQDITKSQPAVGMVTATAKKLAALIPLSNDLIRWSRPAADSMVRNDVVRSMRLKEDVTFIRAQGTSFTPKGIRYWIPAANLINVNATVNLANITVDLGKLILALVQADVAMDSPGWMFAPRTWHYLMTIRDANGNFAYREEMLRGTLWGFPFRMTTQIPINLAVTGTSESEIYLADFADVVIAESENMMIDVSTEASYIESGSLVSAFSRDQTVVRVIAEHDLVMRHAESAACLIDVDWI